MTILALDTSGTTASAALVNEYITLAESSVTLADLRGAGRKTHSETLMPMVDGLFKITAMTLENVDYIACTCGPGSFTGLRIGAATAKGLAFAAGKPLIAVPTLDAMAYAVEGLLMPDTWVVPMIDARRQQAYSAFYHQNERMTDYMAQPVETLYEMIKERAPEGSNIIFPVGFMPPAQAKSDCGSAAKLPEKGCSFFFRPMPLRASCVGAKALTMLNKAASEREFALLYIRKPQAEREREARSK